MPLYEYKCSGCGHQFELLILKASQTVACPSCAGESLERMLSMFAVSSEGIATGKHGVSLQAQQQAEREAGARQAKNPDRTQASALTTPPLRTNLMSRIFRTLATAAALAQIILHTAAAQPSFSFRVVASGLSMPWDVVWGPDDQLWVTERTGRRVIRVNPATGAVTPALSVDESYDPGESWHEGVLGLALHPDLLKGAGRDYVYVAYTYDADAGPALSRKLKVRRYTYDTAKFTLRDPVDVITNLPAHDDHGGGRLVYRAGSEAVFDARRQRRQLARELLHAEQGPGSANSGSKSPHATGRRTKARFCGSTSTVQFLPTTRRSTASAVTSTHTATAIRRAWDLARPGCSIRRSMAPTRTTSST